MPNFLGSLKAGKGAHRLSIPALSPVTKAGKIISSRRLPVDGNSPLDERRCWRTLQAGQAQGGSPQAAVENALFSDKLEFLIVNRWGLARGKGVKRQRRRHLWPIAPGNRKILGKSYYRIQTYNCIAV